MAMRKTLCPALLSLGLFLFTAAARAAETAPLAADDPYQWLEEIDSPKALAWVAQQNETTAKRLAGPDYDALYRDALAVLDSSSRIPEVTQRGKYLYNLWK